MRNVQNILNIFRMYKNIERLQIAKGPKHFNFVPKTFMIPNEYSEFAATHHRMRGKPDCLRFEIDLGQLGGGSISFSRTALEQCIRNLLLQNLEQIIPYFFFFC